MVNSWMFYTVCFHIPSITGSQQNIQYTSFKIFVKHALIYYIKNKNSHFYTTTMYTKVIYVNIPATLW